MNTHNIIYTLDSYKQLHDLMIPKDTQKSWAYLESRGGALYNYSIFAGILPVMIDWLEGTVVTQQLVDEAEPLLLEHFKFNGGVWTKAKWQNIVDNYGGKLPVEICALKEGTKVPVGTPMVSVVNTGGPETSWLSAGLETLLQSYCWYMTTVVTRSHVINSVIRDAFKKTVDEDKQFLTGFYLHDFGQRAATCMEQAGLGGMAHLMNGMGTDTFMAVPNAIKYYKAELEGLAYSVPATEHSTATSRGRSGEYQGVKEFCQSFPTGVGSYVCDSYDPEEFVRACNGELKPFIMARNGKFVVRPDSPRFKGDTPANQILWIVEELNKGYGHTINTKGFKVLDTHVGVIYGDSLTEFEIKEALDTLEGAGWSAENCVYGCGGYLIQKVNRDTQRFAFKASAHLRNGEWIDIFKDPKDKSKASKRGRLKVIKEGINGEIRTVPYTTEGEDLLEPVFRDGVILRRQTFTEIRELIKNQ